MSPKERIRVKNQSEVVYDTSHTLKLSFQDWVY